MKIEPETRVWMSDGSYFRCKLEEFEFICDSLKMYLVTRDESYMMPVGFFGEQLLIRHSFVVAVAKLDEAAAERVMAENERLKMEGE